MNKRATRRLRELFLENRITPLNGSVPFNLRADWKKMKKMYNATPRNKRHATLWKAVNE